MGSPQEAVCIVLAVQEARKRIPDYMQGTRPYSALTLWTYYLRAHHEPKGDSCIYCQMFDGQTFTGSQLRSVFPDHYWDGDDIYPNVHKTLWGIDSTCSCLLIREPEDQEFPQYGMWSQIGTDWKELPKEEKENE